MSFPANPTNNQIYQSDDGRTYIYSSTDKTWNIQFAESLSMTKRITSTVPPTATNDSSSGYKVGDIWINNPSVYILVDSTPGSAIWILQASTVATTPPTTPISGQIYYNSTSKTINIYNGVSWVDITNISAAYPANNLTSTTDPLISDNLSNGYRVGSKWINTLTNSVFLCTNATTSTATWKRITFNLFPSMPTDPSSPVAGDTWFNVSSNTYKGFDGTLAKTFSVV